MLLNMQYSTFHKQMAGKKVSQDKYMPPSYNERRGRDKIRYQLKLRTTRGLVGDQKFGWCRQDFRYPRVTKVVKTLGPFLSANFSTSASSWKYKKYINL